MRTGRWTGSSRTRGRRGTCPCRSWGWRRMLGIIPSGSERPRSPSPANPWQHETGNTDTNEHADAKAQPNPSETDRSRTPPGLTGLLAACEGGGDTFDPTIDPTQLKGRWVTAAGVTSAMTIFVVPDATGTASAWLLAQDVSRLAKLVVRSDSSANGKSYALSQGNATRQVVTGQVTTALAASPKSISFTGGNAAVQALTQSDTLSTSAVQAEVVGTWSSSSGVARSGASGRRAWWRATRPRGAPPRAARR